MEITLAARVPVKALGNVEHFVESAQHLKALRLQLYQLQCRRSRRLSSLAQQIETFTKHCGALAKTDRRLAELWKLTQEELALAFADPGAAPPLVPCSAGARAESTDGV